MMDEDLVSEVTSGLPLSGITKESNSIKLLLEPDPDSSTPPGSIGDVARSLEKMKNRYVPELKAVLVEYGEMKISNLVNMAGYGGGPVEATLEGEFYLFKPPELGQELICRVEEFSSQRLTCSVTDGVTLDVFQFQSSPEGNDLYVGQKILCVVDHVSYSGKCQMRLFGRLVETVQNITLALSSSDRGSPSSEMVATGTLALTGVQREAREAAKKGKVGLEKKGEGGNMDGKGKTKIKLRPLRVVLYDSPHTEADAENNVPGRGVKRGARDDGVKTVAAKMKKIGEGRKKKTMANNQDDGKVGEEETKLRKKAPVGFSVNRDVSNKVYQVWVELKEGRKTFRSIKQAHNWVLENPNYLANLQQPPQEASPSDGGIKKKLKGIVKGDVEVQTKEKTQIEESSSEDSSDDSSNDSSDDS